MSTDHSLGPDISEDDKLQKDSFRKELADHGILDITLQALDPLRESPVKSPDKAWREFQERIGSATVLSPEVIPDILTRWRQSKAIWGSLTAAIIGIVLLFVGWQGATHNIYSKLSEHASTYTTANGQQSTVTLSDGSTVVLNVASTLEVPLDFGTRERTVRLIGEAYFTVRNQSGAPFTVVAGESRTQVLGTRFLVRKYESDSVATVAVQDGKVNVNSVVVSAEQQVEVAPRGVVDKTPTHSDRFSIATGILNIDGISLLNAIPELNRWYNADIRISDPALEREYIKAKFAAGSLADLAEIFELMFDVRIVRSGRVLTLYPK